MLGEQVSPNKKTCLIPNSTGRVADGGCKRNYLNNPILDPVASGNAEDFTFTLASPFSLNANTSYWIVAQAGDTEQFFFWRGNTVDTPTGIASFVGTRVGVNGTPNTNHSHEIPGFRVIAVPEPSSIAMMTILGLIGLCSGAYRRRKN